MRLTGGRSTDGERDYRDEVTITNFSVLPPYIPSLFLGLHPEKYLMSFESLGTVMTHVLFIFFFPPSQVLQFDMNRWVEVGKMSTARGFHAVLSAGPRDLPCLGQS